MFTGAEFSIGFLFGAAFACAVIWWVLRRLVGGTPPEDRMADHWPRVAARYERAARMDGGGP